LNAKLTKQARAITSLTRQHARSSGSRRSDWRHGPRRQAFERPQAQGTSGPFEKLNDWNVIEVIVQGNQSTQILNGSTLKTLSGFQWADPKNPGQWIPLTRGKIAVEFEFAETWYRRLEIKALA
jgi:Domain of Unknown Function (DUF1080)